MPDAIPREAAFWNEQFTQCKDLRQPYEEEWYTNYAFFRGRQWIVWDRTAIGNRLVEPVVPQNRVRLTSNKVRIMVRRETAKLTKEEPIWFVVPNTTEPEDVAAARVSQTISEYILITAQFKKQRRMATFWNSITGHGLLKTTCPGLNEDIVIEPVTPWQFFIPEIQTEELQKQPYCMVVKGMSKDVIEAQYNITLDGQDMSSGDFLEQRFFNAIGMTNTLARPIKNMVLVKEIWIRPGAMKQYPEGGFIVMAGDKIVHKYDKNQNAAGEGITPPPTVEGIPPNLAEIVSAAKPTNYPYNHGKLPFAKMDLIPSGSFYGTSTIVDVIPLQKERNKTRSQMIESKNRTSNPKLAYMKGSLDPQKVTGAPGQMLPINPGYEFPRYIEGVPGNTAQSNEIELLDRDIDDIGARFEVPGVMAASAIAYVKEETDSVLHYTVESIADCIEEVGKQALELAQQFWDETKTIKVVSKNSTQDAMIWRISDIKGNTDLRIETDSITPVSRSAKQAFITGLMKDGIIPPERGLRYLQMNETDRLYEELQADSKQAQRENYDMAHTPPPEPAIDLETQQPVTDPATGQPVPGQYQPLAINPYDDHQVHIYEHGLFLKSQESELLPPELRALVLQHWLAHKQNQEMEIARANQPNQPQPEQPGQQPAPEQQPAAGAV